MNHLLRELAPVSDAAWAAIEDEVKPRITAYLAARKLVDFAGPHGWSHSATNLGRTVAVDGTSAGVEARQRQVLALVELRAPFDVSRRELDDVERGASDTDFSALDDAARRLAVAENATVFHGNDGAGITGLVEASGHAPIALGDDFERYPTLVAGAVSVLRASGIDGPYGLAIAPEGFTGIVETTEHGGVLLLDHLNQILGGPVVWAPGIDGAAVVSLRGGDFVIDVGEDISIGYLAHTVDSVTLYLEESFSFRVLEPDAAVALTLPTVSSHAVRRRSCSLRIDELPPVWSQWCSPTRHLAGPVAQLRRRSTMGNPTEDLPAGLRSRHHPFRSGQQLRATLRGGRVELRAHPGN